MGEEEKTTEAAKEVAAIARALKEEFGELAAAKIMEGLSIKIEVKALGFC